MNQLLIIPGTPLLVAGIDPDEAPDIRSLRERMDVELQAAGTVALVGPEGQAFPSVLGLGGHAIPMGLVVPHASLLSGPKYERYVDKLRAQEPQAWATAAAFPTQYCVAALCAHRAGVRVHYHHPQGTATRSAYPHHTARAAAYLAPMDFSAAEFSDGPLAPTALAAAVNAELDDLLGGDGFGWAEFEALAERASKLGAFTEAVGAALWALSRGARHRVTGTTLAVTNCYGVRYRFYSLKRVTESREQARDAV